MSIYAMLRYAIFSPMLDAFRAAMPMPTRYAMPLFDAMPCFMLIYYFHAALLLFSAMAADALMAAMMFLRCYAIAYVIFSIITPIHERDIFCFLLLPLTLYS